jgi:hypothetical protein
VRLRRPTEIIVADATPETLLVRRLAAIDRQVMSNPFEEILRASIILPRIVPVADLDTDVDTDDDVMFDPP